MPMRSDVRRDGTPEASSKRATSARSGVSAAGGASRGSRVRVAAPACSLSRRYSSIWWGRGSGQSTVSVSSRERPPRPKPTRRRAPEYQAASAASNELGSTSASSGPKRATASAARSRAPAARGYVSSTSASSCPASSGAHGPAASTSAWGHVARRATSAGTAMPVSPSPFGRRTASFFIGGPSLPRGETLEGRAPGRLTGGETQAHAQDVQRPPQRGQRAQAHPVLLGRDQGVGADLGGPVVGSRQVVAGV